MKKTLILAASSLAFALIINGAPVNEIETNINRNIDIKRQNDDIIKDFNGQSLNIYNCADYIDEELISEFEELYNCSISYETYDTNETMYNQFHLQPEGYYDLICASDYMLQKMIREGSVEQVDIQSECPIYDEFASKEVRGKLASMYADTDGDGKKESSLDKYVVGYMWGTLGIVYDPTCSDTISEDVKSWDIFWNEKYNNLISIKNSMRDTFVVGLMHAYNGSEFSNVENILTPAKEKFEEDISKATSEEEKDIIRSEYNKIIQDIFDLVITQDDYESVLKTVKNELIELKKNIFGLEVDSGKNDIITGKIKMNLAWSGDAVYSIDTASIEGNNGEGKVLEYSVPEEGSNVWYDGWVFPKHSDKELACKFLEYISTPENAARNMNYIGYTSFISGDEVFDLVTDWYGAAAFYEGRDYYAYSEEDGEVTDASVVEYDGKFYECIQNTEGVENINPLNEEYFSLIEDPIDYGLCEEPYDFSYLFQGNMAENREAKIYAYEESYNSLYTQYPDEDTLARCAIMNDFEDKNDDVVIMWGQVKAYTNTTPYFVILISTCTLVVIYALYRFIKKQKSTRNKRRLYEKNN